MADINAPDVKLDANSNGTVYFAADVVATIAGLAVTEVEGVANTVSGSNGLADIFARRVQGNARNLTRGVKVEVIDNEVSVDVTIIVEYGSPVPEVAGGIQENVKKAIETMTGMSVNHVDVHVAGVSFERENRAVAELEMQQRKLLEKKQEPEQAYESASEAEKPDDIKPQADIDYTLDDTEDVKSDAADEDDFELVLEEPEPEPQETATEADNAANDDQAASEAPLEI